MRKQLENASPVSAGIGGEIDPDEQNYDGCNDRVQHSGCVSHDSRQYAPALGDLVCRGLNPFHQHTPPLSLLELPPSRERSLQITTREPLRAAARAAHTPASPPPATNTSHTSCT